MAILAVISQSTAVFIGLSHDQNFKTTSIPLDADGTQLVPKIAEFIHAALQPKHSFRLWSSPAISLHTSLRPVSSTTFKNVLSVPCCILNDNLFEVILEEAHYTGFSAMPRTFKGPKLELCYAAALAAEELQIHPENSSFVVAYLGDAISTAAVAGGRIIDMSVWYDEGPFAVHSSGGLPFAALLQLCASASNRHEVLKEVSEQGGLKGYLGVESLSEAEELALKNHEADLIYSAFVYQLAKEIGAYRAVLKGKFDALVLTGPMLPVNGLKGLSVVLRKCRPALLSRRLSLQAAVHFGQRLINSRRGITMGFAKLRERLGKESQMSLSVAWVLTQQCCWLVPEH